MNADELPTTTLKVRTITLAAALVVTTGSWVVKSEAATTVDGRSSQPAADPVVPAVPGVHPMFPLLRDFGAGWLPPMAEALVAVAPLMQPENLARHIGLAAAIQTKYFCRGGGDPDRGLQLEWETIQDRDDLHHGGPLQLLLTNDGSDNVEFTLKVNFGGPQDNRVMSRKKQTLAPGKTVKIAVTPDTIKARNGLLSQAIRVEAIVYHDGKPWKAKYAEPLWYHREGAQLVAYGEKPLLELFAGGRSVDPDDPSVRSGSVNGSVNEVGFYDIGDSEIGTQLPRVIGE